MAYSPSLWLMAIGWWNKNNQCRKLELNLTQTWEICMSLDSGMCWSQNQWSWCCMPTDPRKPHVLHSSNRQATPAIKYCVIYLKCLLTHAKKALQARSIRLSPWSILHQHEKHYKASFSLSARWYYWVKSIISSTEPEEESGGTGRGRFLCVVHLCIMISYTTLGQRECLMYKQACDIRTFNIPCPFTTQFVGMYMRWASTGMHMNRLSNYVYVPKSSSKSWSHTRRSAPVLACVAYSIFVSASFNYTMHGRLCPQNISPLPLSNSTHTHTHTHTHTRTHTHTCCRFETPSSSLSSCGWIKLCMYVCVRMYVCAGFACTWPDWSGLMSLASQQQRCA